MRSGKFELLVVGAEATDDGVAYLDQGQALTLTIISHSAAHHEMALKIGGMDMGLFDLPAGRTIHLLEGDRGPFRFYKDRLPDDLTGWTPATGWIMALFLPLQHERQLTVLPSPVLGPKLADRADLTGYNLDELTCIELLLEDIDTPIPIVELVNESPRSKPIKIVGVASVPPTPPPVSAEALVRYRLKLRQELRDFLRLASKLNRDELELARARLTDQLRTSTVPATQALARLRSVTLEHYCQARLAKRRRQRVLARIGYWVTHPHYDKTLGENVIRRLAKFALPVHPADPVALPFDEDLCQMVDALAP